MSRINECMNETVLKWRSDASEIDPRRLSYQRFFIFLILTRVHISFISYHHGLSDVPTLLHG